MIDLYYAPTPNGWKISIMLEELGLPYNVIPVNIRTGEQFEPDFLKISPNNRIPAIIDQAPADGLEPIPMFETGAILTYVVALAHMPIADVVALGQVTPLFIILAGSILFRERIGGVRMALIGLGFAGALMVAQPK